MTVEAGHTIRGGGRQVFSLRAECQLDVDGFISACTDAGICLDSVRTSFLQPPLPDVSLEFLAADSVTVDHLRAASQDVPDIHVALETLRPTPLADNSLERVDYTAAN